MTASPPPLLAPIMLLPGAVDACRSGIDVRIQVEAVDMGDDPRFWMLGSATCDFVTSAENVLSSWAANFPQAGAPLEDPWPVAAPIPAGGITVHLPYRRWPIPRGRQDLHGWDLELQFAGAAACWWQLGEHSLVGVDRDGIVTRLRAREIVADTNQGRRVRLTAGEVQAFVHDAPVDDSEGAVRFASIMLSPSLDTPNRPAPVWRPSLLQRLFGRHPDGGPARELEAVEPLEGTVRSPDWLVSADAYSLIGLGLLQVESMSEGPLGPLPPTAETKPWIEVLLDLSEGTRRGFTSNGDTIDASLEINGVNPMSWIECGPMLVGVDAAGRLAALRFPSVPVDASSAPAFGDADDGSEEGSDDRFERQHLPPLIASMFEPYGLIGLGEAFDPAVVAANGGPERIGDLCALYTEPSSGLGEAPRARELSWTGGRGRFQVDYTARGRSATCEVAASIGADGTPQIHTDVFAVLARALGSLEDMLGPRRSGAS